MRPPPQVNFLQPKGARPAFTRSVVFHSQVMLISGIEAVIVGSIINRTFTLSCAWKLSIIEAKSLQSGEFDVSRLDANGTTSF